MPSGILPRPQALLLPLAHPCLLSLQTLARSLLSADQILLPTGSRTNSAPHSSPDSTRENASSSAMMIAPDPAPSDLRSRPPPQSLMPPDSLKPPEILHPKPHQASPIPSYFRDSAPLVPPGPSDPLPSPRCCTRLSSGPHITSYLPRCCTATLLRVPRSPPRPHFLRAPQPRLGPPPLRACPRAAPPPPPPRSHSSDPVPQTLPFWRGPAAARRHSPPRRSSATARDSGLGPGSPTVHPAPYLTARGSDASTAASPPARRALRTRRRAPLGGRQFAEPPVRHFAPPPHRHAGACRQRRPSSRPSGRVAASPLERTRCLGNTWFSFLSPLYG